MVIRIQLLKAGSEGIMKIGGVSSTLNNLIDSHGINRKGQGVRQQEWADNEEENNDRSTIDVTGNQLIEIMQRWSTSQEVRK